MNVFDKPRAEPNLFELCRGEKRCVKTNPKLIAIVGTNASGKSAVGLELARRCMPMRRSTTFLLAVGSPF